MRLLSLLIICVLYFTGFSQQDSAAPLEDIYKRLENLEKAKQENSKVNSVKIIKTGDKIPVSSSEKVAKLQVNQKGFGETAQNDSLRIDVNDTPLVVVDSLAPQIMFDSTLISAGTITQGDIFTTLFTFTNSGKVELELFDVVPDCSCTSPEFTKGTIQPGEKGTIKVNYDSKEDIGDFLKTVTILHSAGEGYSFLEIRGFVAPKL